MLEERIQSELVAAMKAKNSVRLETMRAMKAAIQLAKVAKGADGIVSDDEIITIIQKLVKQREESARLYDTAGRELLASGERMEAEIMSEFLPKQMSNEEVDEEVVKIIEELGAKSIKDMGKVMSQAKKAIGGRADSKIIGLIVKKHLV